MRRTLRSLFVIAIIVSPLSARGEAASPVDEARLHLQKGTALLEKHKDEEALSEFAKANALVRSPESQAQLGIAEGALARWVDAEEHLNAALSATHDEWVERHRTQLAAALGTIGQH